MFKLTKGILTDKTLIRNCITAATASSLGNIICQSQITNKGEPIDKKKVLVFTGFGFFIVGPWFRYWRPFARTLVEKRGFRSFHPLQLALLDQAVSPYFLNTCLILFKNFCEQKSFLDGVETVKNKLIPIVMNAYKFWPIVMLVNFYYIPITFQFYFGITASVFWNIALSYFLMIEEERKKVLPKD